MSTEPREIKDKAGKQFWDGVWNETVIPKAANPHLPGIKNLFVRRMDKFFRGIFEGTETIGKSFLELGCGTSIWLPYFAKEFGFKVTGIDYSEIGCGQERQILQKADVEGEIICADFFNPPSSLLGTFDYVYSGGVVEHFLPTEDCISAFAAFLKPGGTMITTIPNLTGTIGWLVKVINRPVYDTHVLLDVDSLRAAHEKVGLQVSVSRYFLSTGFSMVNVFGLDQSLLSTKIKKHIIRSLGRLSVLCLAAENKITRMPETKMFSPYMVCVAHKANTYQSL